MCFVVQSGSDVCLLHAPIAAARYLSPCLCCSSALPSSHLLSAGDSMEAVAMIQDVIMRDTSGMLLFGIVHAGKDDGAQMSATSTSLLWWTQDEGCGTGCEIAEAAAVSSKQIYSLCLRYDCCWHSGFIQKLSLPL